MGGGPSQRPEYRGRMSAWPAPALRFFGAHRLQEAAGSEIFEGLEHASDEVFTQPQQGDLASKLPGIDEPGLRLDEGVDIEPVLFEVVVVGPAARAGRGHRRWQWQ